MGGNIASHPPLPDAVFKRFFGRFQSVFAEQSGGVLGDHAPSGLTGWRGPATRPLLNEPLKLQPLRQPRPKARRHRHRIHVPREEHPHPQLGVVARATRARIGVRPHGGGLRRRKIRIQPRQVLHAKGGAGTTGGRSGHRSGRAVGTGQIETDGNTKRPPIPWRTFRVPVLQAFGGPTPLPYLLTAVPAR